jgi:hypothetical protein
MMLHISAWSVSRPVLSKIPLQPLGPTTAPDAVAKKSRLPQTKLKFDSYPARKLSACLPACLQTLLHDILSLTTIITKCVYVKFAYSLLSKYSPFVYGDLEEYGIGSYKLKIDVTHFLF